MPVQILVDLEKVHLAGTENIDKINIGWYNF
jgi:hypothetical protein